MICKSCGLIVAMPYYPKVRCPYCEYLAPGDLFLEDHHTPAAYEEFVEKFYRTTDWDKITYKLTWAQVIPIFCPKCHGIFQVHKKSKKTKRLKPPTRLAVPV